jgi:hypothetical protein
MGAALKLRETRELPGLTRDGVWNERGGPRIPKC